ncbi:MAG TPA: hypothetical protein VMR75_03510 [Candidatus Saccharimonadales bacterium]|nr:hypothetical protein [Candidatus Saccharimonadales bacterium]
MSIVQTLLFDFDNTAFWTSQPPPGGIDVEQAYILAVEEVLGEEALAVYLKNGGLRNRAPGEVVQELLPRRDGLAIAQITDRLVATKLSHLTRQIGLPIGDSFWPAPCDGFLSFWRWLSGEDIRTGVISSGHTAFIEQAFLLYSLKLPDVIVSDDDIRKRHYANPQWRSKPGTLAFTLARRRLALEYGESLKSAAFHDKSRITYFGDDAEKDGRLAEAAGVRFGHFDPQASAAVTAFGFRFPSWKWVQDRFS